MIARTLKRIRIWLWRREVRRAYYWKLKSKIDHEAAIKLIDLLGEYGDEQGWSY